MESIGRFIKIIFHLSLAFVKFCCIRNHSPKFSSLKQPNFVITGVDLWCLATWAGHRWSGMASLACLEPQLSLLGCPPPHGLPLPRCVTLVNGFPAVKWAIPKVHALFRTLFVSHLLISHWPKQLAKSGFRGWRNRLHFLMGGGFCFLFFHSAPLPFHILKRLCSQRSDGAGQRGLGPKATGSSHTQCSKSYYNDMGKAFQSFSPPPSTITSLCT